MNSKKYGWFLFLLVLIVAVLCMSFSKAQSEKLKTEEGVVFDDQSETALVSAVESLTAQVRQNNYTLQRELSRMRSQEAMDRYHASQEKMMENHRRKYGHN